MKILITGTAGFIGFHLANRLTKEGYDVTGLDNINDYYDVNLKYARLNEAGINKEEIEYNKYVTSKKSSNYKFIKLDLTDENNLLTLFKNENFDYVFNFAAQAGVRYSIINPRSYIDSNINGFFNILEACREYPIKHLFYASSSSVYGGNNKVPFSETDRIDKPVSLYAATKQSNELMAYAYSELYNIHATALRFFSVYGPWGRPDMAYYKFTKAIIESKEIAIYNNGNLSRDFTYIDDIIESLYYLIKKSSKIETSEFPDVLNIGSNKSTKLMDFIKLIENKLKKKAKTKLIEMQPGDMFETWADVSSLVNLTGNKPKTNIEVGIDHFINWYEEYFIIK